MMLLLVEEYFMSIFQPKISLFHPKPGTKLALKKGPIRNYRNLFLANAFPEPDLRYFSKAIALYLFV